MSIKCQNFSPKIQLWKNWPFVRESNGVLFSNTHQTVVRWPWHDMIPFFYSILVVEKGCKVFLLKSWHGKKIAWGSSIQMIHTVYRLFFGQILPTHLNSSWRILEFLEFFLEFFWISLEFFEKILEFFGISLEFWCFRQNF